MNWLKIQSGHALEKFTITQADAAQIREFVSELLSSKNISAGGRTKLTFTLAGGAGASRQARGVILSAGNSGKQRGRVNRPSVFMSVGSDDS